MRFAVLTQNKEHFSSIERCFGTDHIACRCFDDTPSLLRATRSQNYAVALIDARLFAGDGKELLAWQACHADHSMKLIVFGEFSDRAGMLEAFNAGVSDVLIGKIEPNEMYVRTHRVLTSRSKQASQAPSMLSVGNYTLCQKQSLVTYHGESIYLTAREFAMAWLFFSTPGVFFSKQQLASSIWGSPSEFAERSIEQHIYKLRKKLHITRNSEVQLHTAYSLGYQLEIGDISEPESISTLVTAYLQQLSQNALTTSEKKSAMPALEHFSTPSPIEQDIHHVT